MFYVRFGGALCKDARVSYLDDILSQPQALEQALDGGIGDEAASLLRNARQRFSRIVISGMGASAHAPYPAFLRLAAAGVPVHIIETAELLQQAPRLAAGPDTLLWLISQSGESAEITALLDDLPSKRPTVLGLVNEPASALAAHADLVVEMHAGPELAVGTRSFVNTLAMCALMADLVLGESSDGPLRAAVPALDAYLASWQERAEEVGAVFDGTSTRFLLGRGVSLAAARAGALVIKEAAKTPVEGMSSSEFRHGPLELVDVRFGAIVLAGADDTTALNARLASDVLRFGGRVGWLGHVPGPGVHLSLAGVEGAALPIAETVSLQLLSVSLAQRAGVEPGVFRYLQKVTRVL